MKLSDKIRILRKARGLSQEQLGYSLSRVNEDGISRQTVSDWENGNFEPKLENIRDLADVLNVSFDALLDESIDLDDDKVLYQVLNSENDKKKKENTIENSFTYDIYPYRFEKRTIVHIVLAPVLDAIAIAAIVIFALGLINLKIDAWFFIAIAVGLCGITYGLVETISLPRNIKTLLYGRAAVRIGCLTESYLHIYAYKTTSNSIYIPIEKIEKMELGEKANERHGDVNIAIKDRSKPISLVSIKRPQKLVEVFNNLDSYIENPDEIKIL